MATRLLEGQLKAHWKLDSTYGATVGVDSIGSNTLSIGTVASATGKVNEAASFTRASSQYLGIASNSNLQTLKTFAFWVKFTTISNDMTLIHKGSTATAANSSVWIKYDTGNNRIQFQVGDGAASSNTCSTTGFTFATATWYFVVCRYSTALSKLSISINGTLNNSAACSLTQFVETGTFYLGRDATGSYLDGALDEVSVSQSCLTIAEELLLYNGGNGNQPPYLEGPWATNGAAGRYPRRLPPSFAEADNGKLFIAYGDEGVRKWDGLQTTFPFAGVPAPTAKPVLAGSGEGRIIGDRYAYLRNLDADGRVSNLSPISDKVFIHGTQRAITNATNTAPIVVTSTAHGLSTGELVYIDGIQGNKAANGLWSVVNISTNTFSLVGSAGDGEYTGSNSGSVQVTTLQDGAAAVNEVQTITSSATPSGGTWTISFDGSTTSALAAAASAATVQAALEALPSIGTGNVAVTGGALGTAAFTMTFQGTEGGIDQPAMTTTSSLSGASVPLTVAVLTEGSAAASEVQQFQLYGTPTGGTFTITLDAITSAAIAYNANNATIDAAIEAMSNVGVGQVVIGGGPLPGSAVTVTFGGTLANTNVSQMTINGASLTGSGITITMSTPTPGVAGTTVVETFNTPGAIPWTCPANVNSVQCECIAGGQAGGRNVSSGSTSGGNGGVGGSYAKTTAQAVIPGTVYTLNVGRGGIGTSSGGGEAGGASYFLGTSASGIGYPGVGDVTYAGGAGAPGTLWSGQGGGGGSSAGTGSNGVAGSSFSGGIAPTGGGNGGNGGTGTAVAVAGTAPGGGGGGGFGNFGANGGDGRITLTYVLPSGGTNEVQRITIAGTPTQGTFTLTYSGQTTANIAYNATAANVVTALEALSNIGAGNVTGANGPLPGTAVNITFTGTLAATNVAAMTANAAGLLTSFSTTTPGSAGVNEVQQLSTSPSPTSGTFTLTYGANTTTAIAFNATAATIDTALEALASIGAGNVDCTGGPISTTPVLVTFTGTLAATNASLISSVSSLLGAVPTLTAATTTAGVAGVNEKQQLFTQGTVSGGTFTVSLAAENTANIAYDASAATIQTALQAISSIGTSNATATGGPISTTPVTIEFVAGKAATNIAEMAASNTNIVAGGWSRGAALITYSNLEIPTDRRVTKRQVLRNKYGDSTVFYVDVEDTVLTASTLTSTNTDDMLGTDVALQDSNGNDLNDVRHGQPPSTKRAIAAFQNRLFLGVNHRSTSGELSVTNASATVTGEDAFFRTVYATRQLYPQQSDNTKSYNISSLSVPNQTLTDAVTYAGSTVNGLAYGIEAAPPEDLVIYYSEEDDPESWNLLNGLTITRCFEDGDFVGVMPLINSVVFVMQHRLHRLTFRTSPQTAAKGGDGRIAPASWRGGVNNRCSIVAEGKAYILDNRGVYTFNESAAVDISDELQLMFQPGNAYSVYWPARDFFHGCYFAENNTAKWFVTLRDGTYPYHAICYHTQRNRWWIEEYPWPVVSSCEGHINGHQVVFLGSTQHRIFVMGEHLDGISVGVPNTLRGTVTASDSFSLTDSTATFSTSLLANVPVTIVSGKGAGQQRIIVSSTATKLVLKDAWNIAPDTTSTYQLGGVKWTWKGTQLKLSQKGSEADRGVETTFIPTDRAATISLRTYADFSETPNQLAATLANSDGVSVTADSGDVILDLTHTTGFTGFYNDAFFTGRGTHQRYVTAELEGVTNGERQKISEVSIVGVEG